METCSSYSRPFLSHHLLASDLYCGYWHACCIPFCHWSINIQSSTFQCQINKSTVYFIYRAVDGHNYFWIVTRQEYILICIDTDNFSLHMLIMRHAQCTMNSEVEVPTELVTIGIDCLCTVFSYTRPNAPFVHHATMKHVFLLVLEWCMCPFRPLLSEL